MTHPFHPLLGQEFDLVGYADTWGEHRVFFRQPGEERVRSLPAGWTDVEGPDPFLVLSGGRACFRVEDLVALVRLNDELDGRCQAFSGSFAESTPLVLPPFARPCCSESNLGSTQEVDVYRH